MDDFERFANEMARLSERYPEVLLIVKSNDGKLLTSSTDMTWAIGAMSVYRNKIEDLQTDETYRKESDNG